MKFKFFRCRICGNLVSMIDPSGVKMMCCGRPMDELVPKTEDTLHEKHVPVCKLDGNIVHVKIGEDEHPMTEDHYIQWVALETSKGNQMKCLKSSDAPEVCFPLCEGEKVRAVYAYCNIHGLWVRIVE